MFFSSYVIWITTLAVSLRHVPPNWQNYRKLVGKFGVYCFSASKWLDKCQVNDPLVYAVFPPHFKFVL